ncbi:hypothetical protein [Longimicrobium terrae]|uniref:Uncharacterized protein n=1 Tax=Longimicrobium terrae TaxID=1639882 RepID=A0A841H1H3_9BACT|nr:hypothetical protein [Longimicrobium terrae]MBB4637568.1 hypothetical protein [Longimicrobium terrae]MBB6071965.1 hypothetical protein [Longimicrobium terrae]NNC30510.1 hypothetical protein [Longimicrobium terrae]
MGDHRYGREFRGGYGGDYGRPYRAGPGRGYDAGYARPSRYDAGYARPSRYDAGYSARPAYDAGYALRSPWLGEAGPEWPSFIPFGWNPMARWSGWDPGMGAAPRSPDPIARAAYGEGGYAPGGHDRRPRPPSRGYGRDFAGAPRRVDPRNSPTWGRGGDDAVREWARRHGYGMEFTIEPRPRGR